MRIAMVDSLAYTPPYNRALCEALTRQGHEVHMIGKPLDTPWPTSCGSYHGITVPAGLTGKGLPLPKRALAYASTLIALRRRIAAIRPDVVHLQWSYFPLLELAMLKTVRTTVALTMHDSTLANGDRVAASRRIGLTRLVKRADALFSHTADGVRALLNHARPGGIVKQIAHGPLAFPDVTRRQAERDPATPLQFLLFGMIKHYKGLDILVEAAALLAPEVRPLVRFRIVGKLDIDGDAIVAKAQELGVAELFSFEWGFVPDDAIDGMMQQADLFVFPYRAIDASGVLMYALPYRKPIIASALGAFAALLGDGDLLVPSENPAALASAIQRIATDDTFRTRAIAHANDVADRLPRWEDTARDTIEAYQAAQR